MGVFYKDKQSRKRIKHVKKNFPEYKDNIVTHKERRFAPDSKRLKSYREVYDSDESVRKKHGSLEAFTKAAEDWWAKQGKKGLKHGGRLKARKASKPRGRDMFTQQYD
jgi:ribosomal protein S7